MASQLTHYEAAEDLAARAQKLITACEREGWSLQDQAIATATIALAQVHATLATVPENTTGY